MKEKQISRSFEKVPIYAVGQRIDPLELITQQTQGVESIKCWSSVVEAGTTLINK